MVSITDAFSKTVKHHKLAALIPFVTAGFPHLNATVDLLSTLSTAGADIIEIGIPFSDPMADGQSIQYSSEIALKNGMTLQKALEQVDAFRQRGFTTPLVFMGYTNSFMRYGLEKFIQSACANHINGAIIVDLSDSDRKKWKECFDQQSLSLIPLIAPTTAPERLQSIVNKASGFLYFISQRGVTGINKNINIEEINEKLTAIRQCRTDCPPIAVGFGIRHPQQVKEIATLADGIVIGSRLVELIKENPNQPTNALNPFLNEINQTLHAL